MQIRKFGKTREVVPVPSLVNLQSRSYDEFLDAEAAAEVRNQKKGLEAILREFFPITGLDDKVQVSYHGYVFTKPQHTTDECRDLGLTYQRGIKLKIRVTGEGLQNNVLEEDVHIGYFPIRIGGGEFIVNGAERTIVTQIQRSPGVDFSAETATSGKRNFSCRVIPERGSWIEINVTKKGTLGVRIDQSGKFSAMTLLRAANIVTGDNEPYSGRVLNATLNRHGEGNGIASFAIEVRNDLITTPAGVSHWCAVLAPIVSAIAGQHVLGQTAAIRV